MTEDPSENLSPRDDHRPIEEHIKAPSTWLRLLFMIVMVVCYMVARLVVAIVVVLQFFHVLLTGDTNARLKVLGLSLAHYVFEIVEYLTFNSETRPFPFDAEWPAGERD